MIYASSFPEFSCSGQVRAGGNSSQWQTWRLIRSRVHRSEGQTGNHLHQSGLGQPAWFFSWIGWRMMHHFIRSVFYNYKTPDIKLCSRIIDICKLSHQLGQRRSDHWSPRRPNYIKVNLEVRDSWHQHSRHHHQDPWSSLSFLFGGGYCLGSLCKCHRSRQV